MTKKNSLVTTNKGHQKMQRKEVKIVIRLDSMDRNILYQIGYLDGRGRPIKTRNVSGLFKHLLKSRFGTGNVLIKAKMYEIGQLNQIIERSRMHIDKLSKDIQNLRQIQGEIQNGIKSVSEEPGTTRIEPKENRSIEQDAEY